MMDFDALDMLKHQNEGLAAAKLMARINLSRAEQRQIDARAVEIVRQARTQTKNKGLMETFLEEFGLSNNEGLALMCLAESLLRVPDPETAESGESQAGPYRLILPYQSR